MLSLKIKFKSFCKIVWSDKRKRAMFSIFLILIITLPVYFFFIAKKTSAAWFDENWHYRKAVAITNSGSAQTDFQVSFTLDTTDTAKFKSDCSDIRVTDSNGSLLGHWIEENNPGCGNAATKIWTKIPSMSAGASTIYVYYGNPLAANTGDGDKVFDFFDAFNGSAVDDSKWDQYIQGVGGTIAVSGGAAVLTPNADTISSANLDSKTAFTNNIAIEIRRKQSNNSNYMNFSLGAGAITDESGSSSSWWHTTLKSGYHWKWQASGSASDGIYRMPVSGAETSLDAGSITLDTSTYAVHKMTYGSSGELGWYIDGVSKRSATDSTFLSDNKKILISQGEFTNGNGAAQSVDWIFVRKYASAEPALSASSTEEKSTAPVAYWAFDEGQGTTVHDESVYRNDGTLGTGTSAPSWKSESECVSGKCLSFDGNDYAYTANASFITTTNSAHSVFAWVKPRVNNVNQVIWNYGEDYDNNYASALVILSNGHLGWSVNGGSMTGWSADSGITVPANTWSLIGFSHNSSNSVSLYFNGQVYNATITGGTVGTSRYFIGVGEWSNGAKMGYFNGSIDELKVYNYTRTADQIKADYNAGLSGMGKAKDGAAAAFGSRSDKWMTDGLVGYWKMDESTGTAVQDYSGNNNNGTLTNTLEAGTAAVSSDTLNIIPSSTAPFSTDDDAYNGMIAYITGGTGCSVSVGTQKTISDYVGSSGTITVSSAFSAETDNCTYEIRHLVGGKFGNAKAFDGVNDKISVPTASNLDFGQNSFSIGTWVKSSQSASHYSYFVSKEVSGWNSGYELGHYLNGRLSATISGGSWGNSVSVISSTAYNDNIWHHVMLTVDSSSKKLKVFVDGSQVSIYINAPACGTLIGKDLDFSSCTSITATAASSLAIGAPSWTHESTKTFLDEVRIYNRALSSGEVQRLYNWAPGPVGYWKMDEKVSGDAKTILDDSGNGNNGTTNDGANDTGMNCTKEGKYGTACDFDGADDQITGSFANTMGKSAVTLEAWVNIRSLSPRPSILCSNSSSYCIFVNTDGKFQMYLNSDEGWSGVTSANAYTWSDGWHYISATYDAADQKVKLYRDGVLVQTSTRTGLIANTVSGFRFGTENSQYIDGSIDDARVYDYARTQAQIIEDMQNGSRDPLAYYKFDEGYGSTVHNEGIGGTVMNGNLSTGSSAPTWSNDGKYVKALSFDGNDYVDAGTSPAFNDLQSLSVSVWVYPTSDGTSNGRDIIQKNYSTSNPYATWAIERSNDNKFKFTVDDGGYNPKYSANVFGNNQWYFVTMVITPTTVTGYVNGVQEVTFSRTTTMRYDATKKVIIGTWGSGLGDSTQFWIGKIDEPRIYNFALTPDEIKTDYDHGVSAQMGSSGATSGTGAPTNSAGGEYCVPGDTTSCAGPIAEWKMDEKVSGNGQTIYDTSGSSINATTEQGGNGTGMNCNVSGKLGAACQFDGVDDYVGTSSTVPLNTAFSVSFWVKTTTTTTNATPFSWNWYEHCLFNSSMGPGYENKIACADGGGDMVVSTGAVNDGNWHHVEWTDSGSVQNLYVDGKFQDSGTGAPVGTGAIVRIGSDINGRYLSGSVDNVRIYNYVRTPAQIAWEYNKGKPMAEWRMNECQGGTIHDESGNGNNGTISLGSSGSQTTAIGNGTCLTAGTTPWYNGRSGKYGASLNFDGSDDYVNIANNANLSFDDNGTYTWSAWIKPSTINSDKWIMWKGNGADATGYIILVENNNTVSFAVPAMVPDGSSNIVSTTQTIIADSWRHIVVAYNTENDIKIYIDGTLSASGSSTGFQDDTNNDLNISRNISSLSFSGQLDDVKIFNYALTASQIKTLYNASSAVNFGN